jgi:WD40 repeat protein
LTARRSTPLAIVLAALAVTVACSIPFQPVVIAPAPTETVLTNPAGPAVAPTEAPPLSAAPLPTATPAPPAITLDTIGGLTNFLTFGEGEHTRSLAFSPDGTVLASVAGNREDFAIRLWQVPSGQALGALYGHDSIVWGVAFSPDGTLLASASGDRTVKVWDWRGRSLLRSIDLPSDVGSVGFSPDGQTLAVGGVDAWPAAAVWMYRVASWEPVKKLVESWNIPDLAFTPDGQWLVGGGTSRNVRVWQTSDGAERATLSHPGQVTSIDVSHDGSTAATGLCEAAEPGQCIRGAMWLWDLTSGTLIQKFSDFPDWVEGVAFSRDGSLVIAGSRDGSLRAYSTSDHRPLFAASTSGGIFDIALSPDGGYLATGRSDGKVDLWRIEP